MCRILLPDEFIVYTVNNYPAIYAAPSYESAKLKVLDHVLNNVGDHVLSVNTEITPDDFRSAEKWFNCNKFANGYADVRVVGSTVIGAGSCVAVTPGDAVDTPGVVHWSFMNCEEFKRPHPCFMQEYSLVWNQDSMFAEYGSAWLAAAIHYYTWCREYFNDPDRFSSYYYAFPGSSEAKDMRTIREYQTSLSRYPTNESISEAYECLFEGDRTNDEDVAAFIRRRWVAERKRILEFIEETIDHLNT